MLEEAGLRVVASKRIQMSREQAEGFYGVHRERPFFNDLVAFMTSAARWSFRCSKARTP
jgi:nucleoside-diphosphate kinase